MAFFAADNIMSWISSPIVFYPTMLMLGFFAVIHSMGLTNIVMPLIKQTILLVLRKLKIDTLF
jgi:hypothetical protein